SQARAGFEADKWRLFLQNRQSGKTRDLTEKFDGSIGSFVWDPGVEAETRDGALEFTAEYRGAAPIFRIHLDGRVGRTPVFAEVLKPEADLHADDLVWNNGVLFFTRMSVMAPNEIWFAGGPPYSTEPVTHMNDPLLSQIDMQPLESFTFKGANNDDVQGFMVKPPGFDPNNKYPLKFLLHGGPQGGSGNEWTYCCDAQLFAAAGHYVVE